MFLVSAALAPVAGLLKNGPVKPAARQHVLLVLLAGTPLAVLVALSLFVPSCTAVTARGETIGTTDARSIPGCGSAV